MPLLLPEYETRQAHYFCTCVAVMVQCAAAELHQIRVFGRVPGPKEATCLNLNCQETAPCKPSLLDQLHLALWALASQGIRTWRLRQDEKQKVGVDGTENREHSTKVAGGKRRGRLEVCVTVFDSFSLSKQPFVTTCLEKVKQNCGSVEHFQKTLSAVSTLKIKYNLTKQNGHHKYYSDVILHS